MKREPTVPLNHEPHASQTTGVTTNSNGADTIKAEFTSSLKLPDSSGAPYVRKATQQSRMTVQAISSSSDVTSSEYEESSSDGVEDSSDEASVNSEKVTFKRKEVEDEGSRLIGRTKLMM